MLIERLNLMAINIRVSYDNIKIQNEKNFGIWKEGESADSFGPFKYLYYATVHGTAFIAIRGLTFNVTVDIKNGTRYKRTEADLDIAKEFVEKKLGKRRE